MQNELYIVADAIKAGIQGTDSGAACRESGYFCIPSGQNRNTCQSYGYENLYPAVGSYGYSHKRTLYTHGDSEKRYDAERKNLVSGTGL